MDNPIVACAFGVACFVAGYVTMRFLKDRWRTHKLADMLRQVEAARALTYELAYRVMHRLGDPQALVARTSLAKVQATQAMQFCADQAVQLLGGMGFMRGTQSERIYREVKVMMIGGGSEEVMKDLAARQLGL